MSKRKKPICFFFELGAFNIRITNERCDIETRSKLWKTSFADGTPEYGFFAWLLVPHIFVRPGDEKPIVREEEAKLLARAIYACSTMLVNDMTTIEPMYKIFEEAIERQRKRLEAQPQTQSDEEILAEQRVIHEQSEESVIAHQDAVNNPVPKKRKKK